MSSLLSLIHPVRPRFFRRESEESEEMASVNKVIILGRLGRDPETRYASEGGTAICHLAVATSRRYKDRDGNRQEETEWHNVVLFGRTAEVAQQYLTKGSEVYVEGRLRTRSYEKDGQKRYFTEIVGESMQLGARAGAGGAPAGDAPAGFESPARPAARPAAAPAARPAAAPATDVGDIEEDIPF